jgi:hypothetical protein
MACRTGKPSLDQGHGDLKHPSCFAVRKRASTTGDFCGRCELMYSHGSRVSVWTCFLLETEVNSLGAYEVFQKAGRQDAGEMLQGR